MTLNMSQKCPTFNCPCTLHECNTTGRCKHAAQSAGANPVTDAPHMSAAPHAPPKSVQCEYPDGQCRREDCAEACRCRMGFTRDFRTLSAAAQTFASGAATNAATTTATQRQQCHSGWNYVGSIGQAHIWLGREGAFTSNRTQADRHPIALALDLTDLGRKAGEPTPLVAVSSSAAPFAAHLAVQGAAPIPRIDIAWPDFGVPALSRAWWDKLVATLRDSVSGDVVIYCVGGHGRTGTCAAILSVLGGFLPTDQPCPVTWLRAVYCHEVVESQKQIDYIERMTGIKPTASGAKEADHWSSYWDNHDNSMGAAMTSGAANAQGSFPFKPKYRRPTPTLSNNAYRRLIRDAKRLGNVELTPFRELQDGEELEYDNALWTWDASDNRWVYVEDLDGTDDAADADTTEADNPSHSQSLPAWPYANDNAGNPVLSNPIYIDLRMEVGARADFNNPPPPLGDLVEGYFCTFLGRLFRWNHVKKVWDYNSISLNPPAAVLKVWWAKS